MSMDKIYVLIGIVHDTTIIETYTDKYIAIKKAELLNFAEIYECYLDSNIASKKIYEDLL